MLLGQPWIHDTKVVPSSLYQKVWFPHEGAIMTIGKSGFVSHTKHTAEATITDRLHS